VLYDNTRDGAGAWTGVVGARLALETRRDMPLDFKETAEWLTTYEQVKGWAAHVGISPDAQAAFSELDRTRNVLVHSATTAATLAKPAAEPGTPASQLPPGSQSSPETVGKAETVAKAFPTSTQNVMASRHGRPGSPQAGRPAPAVEPPARGDSPTR
jgi:hypothetical protein